jgi:hypothetical protein
MGDPKSSDQQGARQVELFTSRPDTAQNQRPISGSDNPGLLCTQNPRTDVSVTGSPEWQLGADEFQQFGSVAVEVLDGEVRFSFTPGHKKLLFKTMCRSAVKVE